MNYPLAVSALAALALAGCATQGDQYAQTADCKVAPITTASATGNPPKHVSSLSQRAAEFDLASSGYRREQLAQRGLVNNNVEDSLYDCNRK
jgi:hypothetical protein